MFKFFSNKLQSLFKKQTDPSIIEKIEALFYEADFGSQLTDQLCTQLKKRNVSDSNDLHHEIKILLKDILSQAPLPQNTLNHKPEVWLITGINGSGKTTTVAKLANYHKSRNKKTLIVATDTFRAAGITQMELWAKHLSCQFVSGQPGGDPAAIAFDGIKSAIAKQYDTVIIDTSGRLHTHTPLMNELQKIVKVCDKALEGAPHHILMTIDATLGSNVMEQVSKFHNLLNLTGLIYTKVDGSAKSGTLFRVAQELKIPTIFLGCGEKIEDLYPFDENIILEKILS